MTNQEMTEILERLRVRVPESQQSMDDFKMVLLEGQRIGLESVVRQNANQPIPTRVPA